MVDTSPSVMIMPTTFLDLVSMPRRIAKPHLWGHISAGYVLLAFCIHVSAPAVDALLVVHPELKPPGLDIIGPQENAKIPIILQF